MSKFKATIAALCAAASVCSVSPAKAQASDAYIGEVIMVGFGFCPNGWFEMNGQLLPISTYQSLFSLIGITYGGDGRTTFALPDMRGRAPINWGSGPGLYSYQQGQRGGTETVTLTQNEMPVHTHTATVNVSRTDADTRAPANAYFARAEHGTYEESTAPTGDTMQPNTVVNANAGGSQPHANLPPYIVMRYCMAWSGIYPTRP